MIDKILSRYRKKLDKYYQPYLNHAKRVYEYACILTLQKESKKLSIVAAFHDLDIWLSHTMNYLPGSADLATDYLRINRIDMVSNEISFMIKEHHRLTKIKGNIEAEAFRRADLIDLTAGLIKFNIPRSIIVETERKYPRLGFTKMILWKTCWWAVRHPLRPFPMLKW